MKPLNLVLLFAVMAYCACRRPETPTTPTPTDDYNRGFALFRHDNDSAFFYFNKVITNSKDSIYIALAYHFMGTIQSDAGDYYGGLENLSNSLRYLNEHREYDQSILVADYNMLGATKDRLKDYRDALHYYDLALRFIKDTSSRLIAVNNEAVAYQKLKQYNDAIILYNSIIDSSKLYINEYARTLANFAQAKWLQNPTYTAAPELLEALRIRENGKDSSGLPVSFAYLADYYTRSYPDSALFYANKMYSVAKQISNPDDELEALEKLITLSSPRATKVYFQHFQKLNDSLQTARNNAKNQFALIRYETEKAKADNLVLQKDNSDKQYQLIRQGVYLYGTIGAFLVLSALGIFLYRRRRQQLQWKSETAIREHQLKTSQKVHDVVANGLYHIMTTIEHQDAIDKEPLLDKIEALYEQSRDISYDHPEPSLHDFHDTIAELLTSFGNPVTKVSVMGNYPELWNSVKDNIKKELIPVLQEMMVNMKKHSAAHNVLIRFEREDDLLKVGYTDDGVGLPVNFQQGNGIANTGNRIKAIGGNITFDEQAAKGLKIEVFIPTAYI